MSDRSSFVELLLERGERQSSQNAYVFLGSRGRDEKTLAYGELDNAARGLAQQLLEICRPGDRALIVFPPGPDYVAAFYACLYAGVVAVPSYPPSRAGGARAVTQLLKVVRDAQVACVLTSPDFSASLGEQFAAADAVLPAILTVDSAALSVAGGAWRPSLPDPRDLAFLQYTSGSTGDPKGVMVTHGNLMANSALICQRFGHDDRSVGVIWLPPYHDMGLIGGILQPLFAGFPTVLMPPASFVRSPLLWLSTISRFKATTSGGPDFAYAQCVRDVREEDLAQLDLSSWRVAFTGAEPIRHRTLQDFARKFEGCGFASKAFYACYGLAESTLFVTGSNAGSGASSLTLSKDELAAGRAVDDAQTAEAAQQAFQVVSCGAAAQPGHRLRTVDAETLEALPDDRIGEVWVQGPSIALGYWHKADATQALFNACLRDGEGPYLRTGDLGFLRDGQLYVTGRAKDVIIVRGRNHHPGDIDDTLRRASPLFAGAGAITAFARDDALVILCEVPGDLADRCDDLLDSATRSIAKRHGLRVAELVLVKSRSLPKTSSGKLRRHFCQQRYEQQQLTVLAQACASALARHPQDPLPMPATETDTLVQIDAGTLQNRIVAAIADTLQQPTTAIDPDTEFFELGLDSMDLVRLAAALETCLGQPVETSLFFDHPTVRRLVDHLAGTAPAAGLQEAPAPPADVREMAVLGVSCRFPGAEGKDAFWSLLSEGRHAIRRVPASRWEADRLGGTEVAVSPWGGFIDDVAEFDAAFFGIAPKEAGYIDPQQRLLLELAFDALQDAGLSPKAVRGSRTGVFVGISSSDYSLLQTDPGRLGPYSGVGNAHSVAANRISYFFDFQGPSVAVDTACSSSLVALHLACRALQAGDCDLALVGGVNLMLAPHLHVVFSQARMMAADGLCKAFDDRADGYVRGEGAGFLVLRRLPQAVQAGQRILARVLGSAVNQDGRTNGLTAPSGRAQENVIRAALAQAGVQPGDVGYIEAHGTGTKLGDPIELRALRAVFGAPSRERPLLVGSVKGNVGHLEAAAGIVSVIKTVLSLRSGVLPASLHFTRLNQQVAQEAAQERPQDVQVCSAAVAWHGPSERRVAGVSSFGFGGTNCHVVLAGVAPDVSVPASPPGVSVLTLSAESPRSLQALLRRYDDLLEAQPVLDLAALARASNLSRADLSLRWAAPVNDLQALRQRLRAPARGASGAGRAGRRRPKVLFAFSGQGAQQLAMGSVLDETFPVFREVLDRCESQLGRHWQALTLRGVLRGERTPSGDIAIARTEFAQPALFSFQWALVRLWQTLGIEPDGVIGHSLGEYAAACVAGVLRWEDALEMLVVRGRLMQATRQDGRMLAVGADEARTRALMAAVSAASLEIAAVNAPASIVVAGRDEDIERLARHCAAETVPARLLQTQQAFHSADLDPVLDAFEAQWHGVPHARPRMPLYGNLQGEVMSHAEDFGPAYWRRHSRQPVLFGQGLAAALRDGHTAVLEIGPDTTLSALAAMARPDGGVACIPSGRRGVDERRALSEAVAALYLEGLDFDWHRLHGERRPPAVDLPSYPFDRARHWLATPAATPEITTAAPLHSHMTPTPHEPTGRDAAPPTHIVAEVRQLVASLLEIDASQVDCDAPFVEIGADSLMLMSAIQAVEDRYGVKLTVNQLFEQTPTIHALAAFISQQQGGVDARQDVEPVTEAVQPMPMPMPAPRASAAGASDPFVERLIAGQLELMAQHLQLVRGSRSEPDRLPDVATGRAAVALPPPVVSATRPPDAPAARSVRAHTWGYTKAAAVVHGLPAWARQPVLVSDTATPALKGHVERTLQAYIERTATSKQLTQQYRPVLADNRASAGFRVSTKEAVYPVVGKRSEGARMWDVDGNEYIDFTMGFGANLFGHSPDFIVDELRRQLDEGFQLGPQSELAGVVAAGIAKLTGQERIAFCNSGSEAVMTAVRLARTVTRRSKIAVFSGSYHGTFDGILARARVVDDTLTTVPAAPGTPLSFVEQEVLVLEYGEDESLRLLGENAQSLAAVIVEPVQSRHPGKQPVGFLRELRTLTAACGIAMIWDETITGFRAAPGGAQEYFGIRGDIATYGKIIGGGMPIGVVAGKARFLDAIDGGVWNYGDDSYPKAEQTFFAGTFNKHPLALRAANAVLRRLSDAGPALHRQLNERTAALAGTLNAFFEAQAIPVRIEHFSSLFRFAFSGNMDLLFVSLMHKGIYIWEGRNCFLSTAHTDDDIRCFIEAVKATTIELRDNGFFPAPAGVPAAARPPASSEPLALSRSQRRFSDWATRSGDEGVSHIGFALRLQGPALDLPALEQAFNAVIRRHDALRASVDPVAGTQVVHPQATLTLRLADFSALEGGAQDTALSDWKVREVREAFDLALPPLMRVGVATLSASEHVLHLTVHHAVCDGLSLAQLLEEANHLYRGDLPGALPPPAALADLLRAGPAAAAADAAFWQRQVAAPPALLKPRDTQGLPDSAGTRARVELPASALAAVKQTARQYKCTPFMVLCAAYLKLLAGETQQSDLLIGVPFLGAMPKREEARVGCFVELLPIRLEVAAWDSVKSVAEQVKAQLLEGYRRADGASLPAWTPSATFNFEPRALPERFGALAVTFEASSPPQVEFDLMLNVTETSQSLVLDLDFRHRALRAGEAAQWLARLVEIIESSCRQDTVSAVHKPA